MALPPQPMARGLSWYELSRWVFNSGWLCREDCVLLDGSQSKTQGLGAVLMALTLLCFSPWAACNRPVSSKTAPSLQSARAHSTNTSVFITQHSLCPNPNPLPVPLWWTHGFLSTYSPLYKSLVGVYIARILLKCASLSSDWQTAMTDKEWSQCKPCHGESTGKSTGLQRRWGLWDLSLKVGQLARSLFCLGNLRAVGEL